MNELSNSIDAYYQYHFDALPLDKQVHFATRMYAWTGEPRYADLIARTRPLLLPDDDALATLQRIQSGELFPLHEGNQSALARRQQYFAKYPELRSDVRLLYWAQVLTHYFGVDARGAIPMVVSPERILQTVLELRQDPAAVAALSTFAVNLLYLSAHLQDNPLPEPSDFLRVAQSQYDMSDPVDALLCAYLLTHCVINESLFYARSIPAERKTAYREQLQWLDEHLAGTAASLSLDNTFEFTVCCQLVGYEPVNIRLPSESELQLSLEGDFILDPLSSTNSFAGAEHRNVLYLMATTESRL